MAPTLKNIAILGATGNIGSSVIKAIFERKEEFGTITAVTFNDPTHSKFDELKKKGVKVIQVKIEEYHTFVPALKGVDALIIALTGTALQHQNGIIDAAIEAGVKRIYPSEFGFDLSLPHTKNLPYAAPKVATENHLIKKAEEGKTSYTFVITGSFFDWTLTTGFLGIDVRKKTAKVWNEGKDEIYFTTVRDIGRFVAASLIHSSLSHNKTLRFISFKATQAEILPLLEKYSNSKFSITPTTTKDMEEEGKEYKRKGDEWNFIVNNILLLHFTAGTYNPIDNSHFPEVSSSLDTFEETVKKVVDGHYDEAYASTN